jgi:hypothetical protein
MDFNLDKLVVNNVQLLCLSGCTWQPATTQVGSTRIAIFFNDLNNCTLYFTQMTIEFDLENLILTNVKDFTWTSMDIKTESITIKLYFSSSQFITYSF